MEPDCPHGSCSLAGGELCPGKAQAPGGSLSIGVSGRQREVNGSVTVGVWDNYSVISLSVARQLLNPKDGKHQQ